jgi:NhaA family Na+:H+ antiporter
MNHERSDDLPNLPAQPAPAGLLLLLAAALAVLAMNSSLAPLYDATLHRKVGPLSVGHWINDGLMAVFFLLVGLEIKRELVGGRLSRWGDRLLPGVAAFGGMAVPAGIYLLVTGSTPGLEHGWAIAAATDIAFAVAVLGLLGPRVPMALKLLLTTIAIVDDMGAVVIIALAYTDEIKGLALLGAAAVAGGLFVLNRLRVERLLPYLLLGVLLWIAMWLSGVHATIAGVLTAAFVPCDGGRNALGHGHSPLHRLENALQPWVSYAVMPIFGFANAGVSLAGLGLDRLLAPLPLGIAVALFLGKQVGVMLGLWLSIRVMPSCRPAGASWIQLYGMAALCGIGFTMSLFIGGLAFSDALLQEEVKLGVLGGSLVSAVLGYGVLRLCTNGAAAGRERG